MCILAGFNYIIEQGKGKLHLFEVILKTTLTQMRRKKKRPCEVWEVSSGYAFSYVLRRVSFTNITGHPREHTRGEKRFPREM